MTQPLDDYFAALDRLKAGRTIRVPKGTKITNDAVALEAGRGKGSIKKSRLVFTDLIEAINMAAIEQSSRTGQQKKRLDKLKMDADHYRREWEAALAREVCLLYELYEVKQRLAKLTGERVLPIRGNDEAK